MLIGFFGISGVGKTTFTSLLKKECPNILRFSASELIKKLDGEINYEGLVGNVVVANQKKLVIALKEISKIHIDKNILIELHNIIETKEGLLYVNEDVLRGLGLDKVFFIKKEPNFIVENRSKDNKVRASLSCSDLEKIQSQALDYFLEVYEAFDKEVISGSNADIIRISKLLSPVR